MEQLTAVFLFKKKYQTRTFVMEQVSVKLNIDYRSKTFDITPPSSKEHFTFKTSSQDYMKWLTVIECIKEAIEFANSEIGVTPKAKAID